MTAAGIAVLALVVLGALSLTLIARGARPRYVAAAALCAMAGAYVLELLLLLAAAVL